MGNFDKMKIGVKEEIADDKRVKDRDLEEKKVEEFDYENEEKLESGNKSDDDVQISK